MTDTSSADVIGWKMSLSASFLLGTDLQRCSSECVLVTQSCTTLSDSTLLGCIVAVCSVWDKAVGSLLVVLLGTCFVCCDKMEFYTFAQCSCRSWMRLHTVHFSCTLWLKSFHFVDGVLRHCTPMQKKILRNERKNGWVHNDVYNCLPNICQSLSM